MTGWIRLDQPYPSMIRIEDLRTRLGSFAVHGSVNGHAQAAVVIVKPLRQQPERTHS